MIKGRRSGFILYFAAIQIIFFALLISCSNDSQKEEKVEETQIEAPTTTTPLAPQKKRLKVTTYELQNTMVKTLFFDKTDLWIGTTTRGLVKFDTASKDSITHFNNTNALISNGVYSIAKGPEGSLWVGTYGGGMSRFQKGKWTNFNIQHGLCDSFVYDIQFDKKGVMWVATWSGINRIEGDILKRDSWRKITKENTNQELSDNWVYSIEMQEDGTFWFGTEVGISWHNGKKWKNWDHEDGLGGNLELLKIENQRQTSILESAHHRTQGYSTGMIQKEIKNFNPNHITSLVLDKKGNVWIGTWGGGLSKFDGEKFVTYTVKDGLVSNYVLGLALGPDGNIWAGTDLGISRFDGREFSTYTQDDGLINSFTFTLTFDENGKLWAGGQGGVTRIDEVLG
jgi:ligand-binding sensor domain-containing protein